MATYKVKPEYRHVCVMHDGWMNENLGDKTQEELALIAESHAMYIDTIADESEVKKTKKAKEHNEEIPNG